MTEENNSIQQAINEKLGIKPAGNPIPSLSNTKTTQPQLSQSSIRQLSPEQDKPLWSSPKVQIFLVCGILMILAVVLKQLVFGGSTTKTAVDPITPVQATTQVDCSTAIAQADQRCIAMNNAKLTAEKNLNETPDLFEKKTSNKTTEKNTIKVKNLPVRQNPPVIYAQRPQPSAAPSYQRSFQPSDQRSFQPSYQSPIVQPPQFIPSQSISKPKTDPESLWRQLSTDGVTIAQGNSSFTPATSTTDTSYVNENPPVTLVSNTSFAKPDSQSSQDYPTGGISNQIIGSGEGKLLDPIVWAADFDVSGQEFPLKVTKAVGNIPKNSIIYVQLDSSTSNSGLVSLRPTRSDQGDVSGLRITAMSGAPLQAKLKGRGGNGFFRTVGGILLGGVQVAANQALSDSNDVVSSVGSGIASSALSNVNNNIRGGRSSGQSFFEIPKGTTVKITSY
jgi:hypothetical protein